jgi:hypothetical protein
MKYIDHIRLRLEILDGLLVLRAERFQFVDRFGFTNLEFILKL